MSGDTADRVPARVAAALREAARLGFADSCTDAVGRLLAALAAATPSGVVAESGTGVGVGAAWLLEGLWPDGRLVTVERDAERLAAAGRVLGDDGRARLLLGDWHLLAAHAPFDLFFCDGGGKRDDPDAVVGMLRPGGVLVLDDFTPSTGWPPTHEGAVDTLRVRYLTDPRLRAAELLLPDGGAVVVAARR